MLNLQLCGFGRPVILWFIPAVVYPVVLLGFDGTVTGTGTPPPTSGPGVGNPLGSGSGFGGGR